MRIVLDTNVLVSGLLSARGQPAEIVRLVAAGKVEVCHDARILHEYREVLARPRFAFDRERVDELLAFLDAAGHATVAVPLPERLPDPDDEAFLEVALAAGARCLVTGNLKHYPPTRRRGMTVLSPAQFLDVMRRELPGDLVEP